MFALRHDRVLKVMTLCFFICACVISGNANAGFNVVLTAIIYVIYVGILAAVFNKKRSVRGGRGQGVGGVGVGEDWRITILKVLSLPWTSIAAQYVKKLLRCCLHLSAIPTKLKLF